MSRCRGVEACSCKRCSRSDRARGIHPSNGSSCSLTLLAPFRSSRMILHPVLSAESAVGSYPALSCSDRSLVAEGEPPPSLWRTFCAYCGHDCVCWRCLAWRSHQEPMIHSLSSRQCPQGHRRLRDGGAVGDRSALGHRLVLVASMEKRAKRMPQWVAVSAYVEVRDRRGPARPGARLSLAAVVARGHCVRRGGFFG